MKTIAIPRNTHRHSSVQDTAGMKLFIWEDILGYECFIVFASSIEEVVKKCEDSMASYDIINHIKSCRPTRIIDNKSTIISIKSNVII